MAPSVAPTRGTPSTKPRSVVPLASRRSVRHPWLGLPLTAFIADVANSKPLRVPGTAVFMSGYPDGLPLALGHHFKHSKVLHERIVLLSITTEHVPAVPRNDRVRVEFLGEGFVRVSARYRPGVDDLQVGGGWYTQAGGFVELIKGKDSSFNIKVVPGAGIQNMSKLQQGETEIAWGLPPFIAASYNGQDPYKDKHTDMRVVMNGLGYVHIQVGVPADYPACSACSASQRSASMAARQPVPAAVIACR